MKLFENKDGIFFHRPLQLPSSLTSWLFAVAVFMEPLSGVRINDHMSYGDCLFMVSGLVGLCERIVHKEKIFVLWLYQVAAVLITLSYLSNEFFPDNLTASQFLKLVNSLLENRAGTDLTQASNFRVLFASVILFPQAFLLQRAFTLGEVRSLLYIWTAGLIFNAGFIVLFCWAGLFHWRADYFGGHSTGRVV